MDPVQREEGEHAEHDAEIGADVIALPQLERLPPNPGRPSSLPTASSVTRMKPRRTG
jgi:hypothetical protein